MLCVPFAVVERTWFWKLFRRGFVHAGFRYRWFVSWSIGISWTTSARLWRCYHHEGFHLAQQVMLNSQREMEQHELAQTYVRRHIQY